MSVHGSAGLPVLKEALSYEFRDPLRGPSWCARLVRAKSASVLILSKQGQSRTGLRRGVIMQDAEFCGDSAPRKFFWDIGTAGSTTMLALTVLPIAAFAKKPCVFRIRGGLFQDFAPSAFHTQEVLLPALREMGLEVELRILRPGYVPKGGGEIELRVNPLSGPLKPLRRLELQNPLKFWGISLASHLRERKVAERMAQRCQEELSRRGIAAEFHILHDDTAPQPGAALALFAEDQNRSRLGADQAGAPGRPAERIAEFVAQSLLEDRQTGATVDRHLADQLILFCALAKGESAFRIPSFTDHVEANLWLVEELLGAKWELSGNLLRIQGVGYAQS